MASFIDVPLSMPEPTIAPGTQPIGPAGPQPQATLATANPPRVALAQPPVDSRDAEVRRGENYGDPSGRLWMMYLTEAEKEDNEITESWKGDAEGILVFTGLFSSTVASFIIASYPNLSPDPNVTTDAILIQISQQLVNISSGTPLMSVSGQISQPSQPTASAVRVNALWILSLVLSLTCALAATLVQQWARQYLRHAQHRGAPHKRARMRAYIFDGIEKFKLKQAIEAITALLHVSVFLFFAGLVDFFFPINTTIAYFTLGCVLLFALAYTTLTILPHLRFESPYRTPLSGITWRLSQRSFYVIFRVIRGVEGQLHDFLLMLWDWTHREVTEPLTGLPDSGPTKWREVLDDQVEKHQRWFSDGLRKSVELSAADAPPTVDEHALEWTLTALDEDKEIEDFAARIPGFFDSHSIPDPASAILPLMSDRLTTNSILGTRLSDLLKTCISGTSQLTEDDRKRRLRVCLKSLWCCGKAYDQQREKEPLPSYFRIVFASPEMTHRIRSEQDLASRVIGRCFGALVAKKLTADIKSRRVQINDGILVCLSAILGTESREAMSLLGRTGAIELANIISLMSVDTDTLVSDVMLSDVLDVFKQTLRILSTSLLSQGHGDLSAPQVAQFHEMYSKSPHWLKYELQEVSVWLPPMSSYVQREREPEVTQGSWTNISHVSQQSRETQVRIGGAPDSGLGDSLAET